jgi:L,D-transpeptidase YcbB
MRKHFFPSICYILVLVLAISACKQDKKKNAVTARDILLRNMVNHRSNLPFDSNLLITFYRSYPELGRYQEDVRVVYRSHRFTEIWYDKHGLIEFGQVLYGKVNDMNTEGVASKFPYQEKVDAIFDNEIDNSLSPMETDMMLTNLYMFYAEKVFKGLDDTTSRGTGWLLPRKEVLYDSLLVSAMSDPSMIDRNDTVLLGQYYKLRDVLQRYREIENKGGWKTIDLDPKFKAYKPGDTAKAIRQIRERLFVTGDISENNGSNKYDDELVQAVKKYQECNGFNPDKLIYPKHIKEMNVPVSDRIKTIIVNMERCRWIPPEFARAKAYIVVNIPSYTLSLFRDGKPEFTSPVIVGKYVTKTVVFSGNLSYIVFSPYWNLPQSIINKEVKPEMAKHKNYLETHNMEWNDGQVRQKPGKNNSLGLVKFMFPNSNDIYMHDTPAKSLFAQERRAFSHGCIRVAKARDLAVEVLRDDPGWTPEKIDRAMHAGVESSYTLKTKIPVFIGYLTAWVDRDGEINFYHDVYDMDERLSELLTGTSRP